MQNIPGFEGLYSADVEGNVYSFHSGKPVKLKLTSIKGWYAQVNLCKNGIRHPCKVHRLIAMTFLLNPENKKDINHKNGIKYDNRLINLEWASRSENIKHCFRVLNRIPVTGERHPKYKPILDFQTGIFYESAAEIARAKNIEREKMKNGLRKGKIFLSAQYV